MPLDPQDLLRQIEEQRASLEEGFSRRRDNTSAAVAAYQECDSPTLGELVQANPADRAMAYPATTGTKLTDRSLVQKLDSPYTVVATDSSPIPPDRHNGTALYHVINVGKVLLRYGPQSDAVIESETHFYAGEVTGEEGQEGAAGLLLDVKSAVHELRSGFELARQGRADLVLRDGPLTLWNSATLRDKAGAALRDEYYKLLERFKAERLPLVGYISNTHSTAVTNALRFYIKVLPPEPPRLFDDAQFATTRAKPEPKKSGRVKMRQVGGLEGVQDAMLFARLLSESERGPIFKTALGEPRELAEYIGSLCFTYLRTPLSNEIARLEFPEWLLQDPELLERTFSLVMNQYELGQGYPVALMEAHESAVLRGDDRELLRLLLEERGLLETESEKGRSKRLRGI